MSVLRLRWGLPCAPNCCEGDLTRETSNPYHPFMTRTMAVWMRWVTGNLTHAAVTSDWGLSMLCLSFLLDPTCQVVVVVGAVSVVVVMLAVVFFTCCRSEMLSSAGR